LDKEILEKLVKFLDAINDSLAELNRKMDVINTNIGLIVEIKDKVKGVERLYE
jgi:prefoldin subunit 5